MTVETSVLITDVNKQQSWVIVRSLAFYLLSCQSGLFATDFSLQILPNTNGVCAHWLRGKSRAKRKCSTQLARLLTLDFILQRTPFGELRSPYFVMPPRHVSSTFSLTLPVFLLSISTAWSIPSAFPSPSDSQARKAGSSGDFQNKTFLVIIL